MQKFIKFFLIWFCAQLRFFLFEAQTSGVPCQDQSSVCPQYYAANYCNSNYPTVLMACPLSCKLCQVNQITSTTAANTAPCVDLFSSCPQYYTVGYCSSIYPQVLIACPLSCKVCTSTSTTTTATTTTLGTCKDSNRTYCLQYFADGYCNTTEPSYTSLFDCPFSCQLCSSRCKNGGQYSCLNGGTCLNNGTCMCLFGYTGLNCESQIVSTTPKVSTFTTIAICKDNISFATSCIIFASLGYCTNVNYQNFVQQNCHLSCNLCPTTITTTTPIATSSPCLSSPCLNGATCVNSIYGFSCICNAGYTGNLCSYYIGCNAVGQFSCQNGGVCNNEICQCTAGYSGNTCSNFIGGCLLTPCQNSGTCHNSGICLCAPGFTGTDCSYDINECTSFTNVCQMSSVCINTVGSYFCNCSIGFAYNQYQCVDINECLINNGDCNQICNNTIGSYVCSCFSGYQLSTSANICSQISTATVVTSSTSGPTLCNDADLVPCKEYALVGYCTIYPILRSYCPYSCMFCQTIAASTTTTISLKKCVDSNTSTCLIYLNAGYCIYESVKYYCPLSCQTCHQ